MRGVLWEFFGSLFGGYIIEGISWQMTTGTCGKIYDLKLFNCHDQQRATQKTVVIRNFYSFERLYFRISSLDSISLSDIFRIILVTSADYTAWDNR